MAKTTKPRITFKKRYQYTQTFTIYANGKTITRSTDGDESWISFGFSGDTQPYDCSCFLYVNDRLLLFQLQATPETIPDTLKALRPIIQQAIINGTLQAAGALNNESK